jgi:hypothetical protein
LDKIDITEKKITFLPIKYAVRLNLFAKPNARPSQRGLEKCRNVKQERSKKAILEPM